MASALTYEDGAWNLAMNPPADRRRPVLVCGVKSSIGRRNRQKFFIAKQLKHVFDLLVRQASFSHRDDQLKVLTKWPQRQQQPHETAHLAGIRFTSVKEIQVLASPCSFSSLRSWHLGPFSIAFIGQSPSVRETCGWILSWSRKHEGWDVRFMVKDIWGWYNQAYLSIARLLSEQGQVKSAHSSSSVFHGVSLVQRIKRLRSQKPL